MSRIDPLRTTYCAVQQFGGDGSTGTVLRARVRTMAEQQIVTGPKMGLAQATKVTEAVTTATRTAGAFGRGNLEATARSAQIYLAGTQDLGRQVLGIAQALSGQAFEGAKALAAAKSVREAVEIQASLVRGAVERSLSEGTELQQAAAK